MSRKEKVEEILQILRDKKGEATFGFIFSRMFEKHHLTKLTCWDYLEALKTARKIAYPEMYIIGQENEMVIKLCGEKKE
jgi:hypothetical protein